MLGGANVTKWSHARREIIGDLARAHSHRLLLVPSIRDAVTAATGTTTDLSNGSPEAFASVLVALLDKEAQEQAQRPVVDDEDQTPDEVRLTDISSDRDVIMALASFMVNQSLDVDPRFHIDLAKAIPRNGRPSKR